MKKISVHGIGKAGLPLAVVIAESGSSVIGVGRNPERVKALNRGLNPIPEETGLTKLLKKHIGHRLSATTDAVQATLATQIHIVIVPLFITKTKKPDFSNIIDATIQIAKGLKKGDIVVLETTVPVGTTDSLLKTILEKNSGLQAGKDFYLGFSPERMMTGYAISRYQEFPKVVSGINKESLKAIANFYRTFCKKVIEVGSLETAELTKIAEGVYRDVNIALANELLKVAQKSDVDFFEMRQAALHNFSHIHEPGNVGGHCIPVYPWFLIHNFKVPLIKKGRELNDNMIKYYAQQLKTITPKTKSKVLVIGISFREGVKETAYTRSFPFIAYLKKQGYSVSVYDPLYSKKELEDIGYKYSHDFGRFDGIVLMNHYPKLVPSLKKYKKKIVDIKNSLAQAAI